MWLCSELNALNLEPLEGDCFSSRNRASQNYTDLGLYNYKSSFWVRKSIGVTRRLCTGDAHLSSSSSCDCFLRCSPSFQGHISSWYLSCLTKRFFPQCLGPEASQGRKCVGLLPTAVSPFWHNEPLLLSEACEFMYQTLQVSR